MTKTEIKKLQEGLNVGHAWAAGLFEGEGCISISTDTRAVKPRHGRPCAYTSLKLSSTDEDVVRRFHEILGVGSVTGPYQLKPNCKPNWTWGAHGIGDVQAAINILWPFLGERRRARAQECLTEDTRLMDVPVKVCVRCTGELDGSHRSYCKRCFATYVRGRYVRKAA